MAGVLGMFGGVMVAQDAPPLPGPAAAPTNAEPSGPVRRSLTGNDVIPDVLPDVQKFAETRAASFRVQIPVPLLEREHGQSIADARVTMPLEKAFDSIELSYEGERSQIPTIAAVIDEVESESDISAQAWRSRSDRSGRLAFVIKAVPENFGQYTTLIEHYHVNDCGEMLVKTIPLPNLETFETNRLSVPFLLPGVNRLLVRISLAGADGMVTTSRGVSHLITVQEVAAMGLELAVAHTAVRKAIAGIDTYSARIDGTWNFTLSPALDPSDVRVRVLRRGAREYTVSGLDAQLRRWLPAPIRQASPVMVAEAPLVAADMPELTITSPQMRQYAITLKHALGASSSVLPVADGWEYIVELRHPRYVEEVDTFSFFVGAGIPGSASAFVRFGRTQDTLTTVPFAVAE